MTLHQQKRTDFASYFCQTMSKKTTHYLIVSLLTHGTLSAQQTSVTDSLLKVDMAPVMVTAARLETASGDLPYALSVLSQSQIQRAQSQSSLFESMTRLPGVFVLNADNFSQDLRISIRGFGARSAFGIRGIRILVDGLPESTPDGQAEVDNIDVGAIRRMELLRGAAAGLYGNASGGILNLMTEEPADRPFVEMQGTGGSFGFQRYQVKTGFYVKKVGVFASLSQNQAVGYRSQSSMQQTTANLKMRWQPTRTLRLSLLANYGYSPYAQDAGGLTAAEVATDRRKARAASRQFDGGEITRQGKVGLVLEKKWSARHSLDVKAFVSNKNFANRLAFKNGGWVEFDRLFGGASLTYQFKSAVYRSQVGVEWNEQQDYRTRYDNLDGQKGVLTLDQTERFSSTGVFWINEYTPFKKWIFNASTRLDGLKLSANDQFLDNGDQSGAQQFVRFNPAVGMVYVAAPGLRLYTNLASNFETPTLNELSANPYGPGGFNPELAPQQSLNYELGVKGQPTARLGLEVAVFQIRLRDELVPYQLVAAPGRTFYRNAGASIRLGVESALNYRFSKGFSGTLNYTYSDFKYKDYEANGARFDGNRQPGVPQHQVFAVLQWEHRSGFFMSVQARRVSKVFVDDANSAYDPAYTLGALRAAYSIVLPKGVQMEPFAGVNNLFGATYSNNLLLNAVGGRFFEPAADEQTVYAGVKVRF